MDTSRIVAILPDPVGRHAATLLAVWRQRCYRISMRTVALIIALLVFPFMVLAQPRKVDIVRTEQPVGSWLLTCTADPMTDAQNCQMRHRLWVAVPKDNRGGLALEVVQRSDQLVPALTMRDISLSTAWGGLLTVTATAQIRFDGNPMIELPCSLEGFAVICVPAKADAVTAAEQLTKARTVLIRLRAIANLPLPVLDDPVALDLDRTQEALARYRIAGPAADTSQTSLAQDVKGTVERLLRKVGVPGMEPAVQGAQPK
jgi:hypothetical protein